MDDRKLIPVCDITIACTVLNPITEQMQHQKRQTVVPNRYVCEEIHSMGKKKKKKDEVKIQNSEEEHTSEVENVTPEDTPKSEYEKMVQKNREERLAFLEALKIDEVKESFYLSVQNLKPKPKNKNMKRPSNSPPPPRRKSRRLAKMDIDLSESALMNRALEEAIKEREEPQELPALLPFEEALKDKEQISNFIKDFDVRDMKEVEPYNQYTSRFNHMQISESQVAKVVPGRITALAIHPICDKIIVIAGDKYGNLGFWNMNSDSNPYVMVPHVQGVTNLKVNPFQTNQVISSSYDGTLRCGDMNQNVFNEVYSVFSNCCTYFDVLSPTTYIVGHKSGDIAVVDYRSSKKTVEKKHECHDYTLKSVSVHPVNKNYFLTSEVKGAISLWDLRKLQKKPVLNVYQHKKSATSAFFSSLTGNRILSTSADDSLCVFDSSSLVDGIPLKRVIKHNNFTGRWLSIFRATWLPNTDDVFVVGSMLYPRKVEIYNANGSNIHNFIAEDLTSITSLHAFHPHMCVMVGGNSSGKAFVFTD